MPQIKIPTPLRPYAEDQAQIAVGGNTVAAALDDLVGRYPDLQNHLFESGRLRQFVNVFVGDEDVRFLDGLETEIDETDSLRIIPSIAGGSLS